MSKVNKLFITNNRKIFDTLGELYDGTWNPPCTYRIEEGSFIVLIEGQFHIDFNGTGKTLHKFYDGVQGHSVTVKYVSLYDLKVLNDVIRNNSIHAIINACDSNASGQYIFEVVMKCINKNSLDRYVLRLWCNSLDIDDLKKAYRPNSEFIPLYHSCLAEKIIDHYWFIKSEELFGRKVYLGVKELILLNLLNLREKEILEREARQQLDNGSYSLYGIINNLRVKIVSTKEETIKSKEDIVKAVDEILNKQVFITNTSINNSPVPHPLLFNTSELLKEAKNAKLGELDEIKKGLDELYHEGYITNPDTISNYVSSNYMNRVKEILRGLYKIPVFSKYIKYIESKGSISVDNRVINNTLAATNVAIVPTATMPDWGELSPFKKTLYTLITKRFLSVFMGNSLKTTVSMTGIINNSYNIKYEKVYDHADGWVLLFVNPSEFDEAISLCSKNLTSHDYLCGIEKAKTYLIEDVETEENNIKSKLPYSVTSLLTALQNSGKNIRSEKKKVAFNTYGVGVEEDKGKIITYLEVNKLITIVEDRVRLTPAAIKLLLHVPSKLVEKEHLNTINYSIKDIIIGNRNLDDVVKEVIRNTNNYIEMKRAEEKAGMVNYKEIIDTETCPYCFCSLVIEESQIKCSRCHLKIPKEMYSYILKEKDIRELLEKGETEQIKGFIFKNGRYTNGTGKLKLDYILRKPKITF